MMLSLTYADMPPDGATSTELDDPRYNLFFEVADKVLWFLQDHRGEAFVPSAIGRRVKVDTLSVQWVLQYLVAHQDIETDDRGAWSKYWDREGSLIRLA